MNLFINNIFWTFQGEGKHAGRRALFVRMPACNLSCSWCDTDFSTSEKVSLESFKSIATQEPARFAVITGGEPLMHRHTPIVAATLQELGFHVACETNGTFPPVPGIDFITCSPKADAEFTIHPDLYPLVSEFKYIVDEEFDFKLLDRHKTDPLHQRLTLSPEFGTMAASVQRIVTFIQHNPRWNLSVQTHKWIGIP